MDLHFYHLVFTTRAQASASAAQERARYPVALYETDIAVVPRTDRPSSSWIGIEVPEHLQAVQGAAHQWAVDGSRLLNPKAR